MCRWILNKKTPFDLNVVSWYVLTPRKNKKFTIMSIHANSVFIVFKEIK